MGCEVEHHKYSGLKFRFRVCGQKDAASTAEVNIFEMEGYDVQFGSTVLSWAEE